MKSSPLPAAERVPDVPAWDSVEASRRPDRPGVGYLLHHGTTERVLLSGIERGEAATMMLALARFGGQPAVVLGQQGDDCIALDEFAELAGSIPHEALANLGSRVPRVYWRGSMVVATATLAGEEWLDAPVDGLIAESRDGHEA